VCCGKASRSALAKLACAWLSAPSPANAQARPLECPTAHGYRLAIAVPVSLAVERAMASLVFGIVSINFAVIEAFSAVLLSVALTACYIPARRGHGHRSSHGITLRIVYSRARAFFATISRPHSLRSRHAHGRSSNSLVAAILPASTSNSAIFRRASVCHRSEGGTPSRNPKKELPRFGQAETAGLGAFHHGELLYYRRIVPSPAAGSARPRQHTGLLVITDRRSRETRFFRHLPNRHAISLLDFKLTLRRMIAL